MTNFPRQGVTVSTATSRIATGGVMEWVQFPLSGISFPNKCAMPDASTSRDVNDVPNTVRTVALAAVAKETGK